MRAGSRWFEIVQGIAVGLCLATVAVAAEPPDTNLLPNGSFEFWVRPLERNSKTGRPSAAVPARWALTTDGSATLVPGAAPHGGRQAVTVQGARGRATFEMRYLEVYPGATYRFGVWARGKGNVTVSIDGVVMEGEQTLASAKGAAGADWAHIGGAFTVPRHVLDRIRITVAADAGTEIDDAHVSARLNAPFDADAVLRDKPRRDADTILFEDFDGSEPDMLLAGDSKSGLTGADGGRFGRGLRMVRPGMAVFSLALKSMPTEGTLEYWITQGDFQKATQISLMSPGDKKSMLALDGSHVMRVSAEVPGGKMSLFAPGSISCEQARDGQWLHVAVEWDEASLRLYLNGVLADIALGRVRWPKTPGVICSGSALQWLCWNGVLDEVRFSKVRRSRPPVPAGFTPYPPVVAAAVPPPAGASAETEGRVKPYDPKALRAARGKLPLDSIAPTRPGAFETTPDESGSFIYEATSLRPLIGDAPLALVTNKQSGMVLASLRGIRAIDQFYFKDNEGGYWKLGAIPEGDYWIRLLHTGGDVALYVNGRIVQFGRETGGLRAGAGLTLTERQTGRAVRLRPGDELAVMAAYGWRAARLIVSPQAPPRARHYVAPHYDPHTRGPDTALAVNGQVIFRDTKGAVLPTLGKRDAGRNQVTTGADALQKAPDGRPAVLCELFNPLPTAVEIDYFVAVRSFYRLPVGGEKSRIRLEPHSRVARLIPFDALEDERAFSAELNLQVVAPQSEAAWRRQMHWPLLDWIDFFPGMRQGLAWPETFADYDLRRVEFSRPVQAVRRSILLDGGREAWEHAYSADWQGSWPTAEALEWEPAEIPVNRAKTAREAKQRNPKANTLYARRHFVLPDDAAEQSCVIVLSETAHAAEMFVNGIEVGRVRGGNAPLRADATAASRPGTNELVIVTHNALAIMDPAYINPAAPQPNLQYLDAPGLYDAWALGLGSVELHLSPRVAARALRVIPSTRQETLRALFELVNHRDRAVKLSVRARVFDGDRPVFELGERELEVAAGASVPVEFGKPWKDARWWWPFDPHLYVVAIETFDTATGKRIDRLRERFGFRESWINGPDMMLNDMAIRPKGSWLGYREAPNHFARGVDGSAGPDWTDERGMMGGTYITQLSNTGTRHAVESDLFWEICKANALSAAMLRINNPSVMRWDMSNEWLIYLYGGDPKQGAQRFKHLSDTVRAFDPTRWTTFGAEGDVSGLMDHFDFHYMSPYFQDAPGYPRMRGHSAYLPDGRFWRELDTDFEPGKGIPLCPHKNYVILHPDQKMFFERESLWKTGGLMPPGITAYAGENAVLWSAWDAASGPSLWMWKQEVDGRRDLGVSLINHFTHPGLKRRAMALQTFIVPEVQHHAFGGRTIERRYALLQDIFRTCDMTFRWTLHGPDGNRLDGGEDRQRMTSGTTYRGMLSVKLPDVKTRTVCVLALELESDGELVMAEERDIDVWPDEAVKVSSLARKVVLFEPGESSEFNVQSGTVQSARVQSARVQSGTVQSGTVQSARVQSGTVQSARVQSATVHVEGVTSDNRLPRRSNAKPGHSTTAAALTAAGVPFELIADFGALTLSHPQPHTRLPLLVIAENALNASNRTDVARLSGWVERGGRVLILQQTVAPAGLPVETTLDTQHWASQCYIRAGNHPIMAGWTDWDFHFWADDRAVVRGGYVKPTSGAALVLLDSGETRAGLDWTGLMELYRGAGNYLLCQLPVIDKIDQEPMARELLARMVQVAAGEQAFACPTNTLTVLAAADSPIVKRWDDMGAKVSLQSFGMGQQESGAGSWGAAILVDAVAGRGSSAEDRAALGRSLRAGATVVVARAEPEDGKWLSELAGRPVNLGVTPNESWDGRGMRGAWTPFTAGLSQIDLYWKRFDGESRARMQVEDPQYLIEPLQEFAAHVTGEGVVESVWPGALLDVACGRGRLVLDQRNLYTSHPDLTPRAVRNLIALGRGMGVRIDPPPPRREMAVRKKYRAVDLASLANRALSDETAGDGRGGWTDEGAEADMRRFPTGKRRVGNVWFEFAEGTNQAVALAHPGTPLGTVLPERVTIPIGDALEGLYFLHTVAGVTSSLPSAVYTIAYQDGSEYAIRLENGVNIRSWTDPGAIKGQRGTASSIAWTGSTPRYPLVGVYLMEWVNPWPERRIETLTYALPSGHAGLPLLLALTAVLNAEPPPAPRETPVATAAVVASSEQMEVAKGQAASAAAALRDGDEARARALAGKALKLDSACEEAHALLLDLSERAGNEEEVEKVCRAWIAAGARIPRPYNRVGALLEQRKDWRGALAAYTRSLALEWNQPPIIEAKSRVEKLAK